MVVGACGAANAAGATVAVDTEAIKVASASEDFFIGNSPKKLLLAQVSKWAKNRSLFHKIQGVNICTLV